MHLPLTLLPKAKLVRPLETYGCSFLKRTYGTIADSRVRRGNEFDQMLRPNQPADAPASGVEVLACGANREGQIGDFGGQAANASKGNVIEAVVDLVGRFSWEKEVRLGKSREIAYLV